MRHPVSNGSVTGRRVARPPPLVRRERTRAARQRQTVALKLPTAASALADVTIGPRAVLRSDADPVLKGAALALDLVGSAGPAKRLRSSRRAPDTLQVRVHAMDLRQVDRPILVGHYEQDAISGPEALIDQELVRGELSIRHHLGLYAGAVGSASAVLLSGTALERQRGSYRGAVVAGLGKYDGSLTVGKLTDAVRTAGLRYLVHVLDSGAVDSGCESPEGLKLASLLIGYNSSANLTIADSVQALLRGVTDANRQFAQATRSKLHIAALDIVEIYIDTAISATYAAQAIAQTMNADPRRACRVDADSVMHQGEGMRQRLFDERGSGYWPRLLITNDDRPRDEPAPAAGSAPSNAPAERLRYLYLGQRARAESVLQQSQPGLVERLVASQVGVGSYDADFSRTLFQLLVPHDFKDAARQMQQMVFVLDAASANLPWELLLADEQPLATQTAMVRQLESTRFRVRVNQTLEWRAYVVGNPSTSGFGSAFPDPRHPGLKALDPLPAAEQEADLVSKLLACQGFEVERAIGQDQRAIDVVNRLYKHPYRIVHVAGHGLFDERAAEGRERSGVVLSDGLMITAAEIESMEVVPELVFLNCCHLGKMQRSPLAFNKLAYSVARQLIDIGVRAVVVAGWAVEDAPASLFAQTFYEALMQDDQSFGNAVFIARKTTWARYPASITWGAYQAYGDPGWKIDPKSEPSREARSEWRGVAPEELIDKLQARRQALQRRDEALSSEQAHALVCEVQQWFRHAPDAWLQRPDLYSALGDLYADLGHEFYALACECFERAVLASDRQGKVPIKAIEELANAEGRLAESTGDVALAVRAIDRLQGLVAITGAVLPGAPVQTGKALSPERAGLLGSAYKRKAAIHARAYLAGNDAEFRSMRDELARSAEAYGAMASEPDAQSVRPYHTLNWLFLWSLTADPAQRIAQVPLAQRCAASANAACGDSPEAWNATMVADASLVVALLNQNLDQCGALGDVAIEQIACAYEDCLHGTLITPRERDAVMRQIALMSVFCRAREKAAGIAAGPTAGTRLQALAQRLMPPALCAPAAHDAPAASAQPVATAGKRKRKTTLTAEPKPRSQRRRASPSSRTA
jgi:tetratricopeptide (TPR) repeat protein